MQCWEDRSHEEMGTLFGRNSWLKDIKQDDADAPCYRNEQAQRYVDIIQRSHIEGLTQVLVEREASRLECDTQLPMNAESYRGILAMMVSIDPDLLRAIIEGQVARKAEIPCSAVFNQLVNLAPTRDTPPSIYQNAICDREGISPTPSQWLRIQHLMQLYVSDTPQGDELALRVDQIVPSKSFPIPRTSQNKRLRRYTDFDTRTGRMRFEPHQGRRGIVWKFTERLLERLQDEKDENRMHTPLVAPVVEIGFSNNVARRLRDHRRHRGSNYIMNLAQALFEDQYPKNFCLKQHVIYHCWSADQPWPSEVLLTRLGQGYISGGTGFSHHPAGLSNGRPWEKRSMQEWIRFEQRTITCNTRFWDRLEAVGQRTRRSNERKEAEARLIERIQKLRELVRDTADLELACTSMQAGHP
ncbi:MAG: hypothetical protein Q9180_000170 [Flavoplaca navasiana]